jgi:anti-sigma B factor antagonist
MNLFKTSVGTVDVIRLPERLTMADAADYRHAIRDLVDQGHTQLVMDMGRVDFVDSSGLSVLVSAIKAAREADGDVVLANLTPQVQALVELTRLHHLFEIFADRQSGVDYLDSQVAA